jgi:hypothetical protein
MLRQLPYGNYSISIHSVWKRTVLFFILTLLISGSNTFASNGVANNSTGNWNNPSTWLFNGSPGLPACGDSVFIPAGHTVTVNSQENYLACVIPMYIEVSGILQFTNGNKLDLPCGSHVRINAGGLLKKVTAGGGNSTLITICGSVVWAAGDGDLAGPALLGDPLPVSLLSFTAKTNDGSTVDINWTTASEINNSYFIVQRSLNSLLYSDIFSVDGAGNSNELRNYFVKDETPVNGINYYRLCQVDFDGTRTYYHPVAVRIGESGNVLVYPNPAADLLWIEVPSDAQATIRDIYGKLVSDSFIQKGISSTSLKDLSAGVYTVKVENGTEMLIRKIVIQK